MPANKVNLIAGLQIAEKYESIAVGATAVSFTAGTRVNSDGFAAKRAVVTVEDAQIRYRYDGTAPTASEGHLANPMDAIILKGNSNINNFQAIRKGSTNATIRVTYEF